MTKCKIINWNYDEDFGWEYHTDCSDIPIDTSSSPNSFKLTYKYCPFCGKELDFSGLSEFSSFSNCFNELCQQSNLTKEQIETLVKTSLKSPLN